MLGFIKPGVTMFAGAEKLNWECIVSKRADAPYRSNRNAGGLKVVCLRSDI